MTSSATPARGVPVLGQKSVDECRRRLKESPADVGAALRLADALEANGGKREAVGMLNRIGPALQKRGRLVEAIAVYKRVVKLDPKAEVTSSFLSHLELKKILEDGGQPAPPVAGPPPSEQGIPPAAPPDAETLERRRKKEKVNAVRSGIPLLKDIPPFLFELVLEKIHLKSFPPGGLVFTEGEAGSSILFVVSGALQVTARGHDGTDVLLGALQPGDVAGEISFLAGVPRTATLTATAVTDVLELDRTAVNPLVRKHRQLADALSTLYAERVLDGILARSRLFGSLSRRDREAVAKRFLPVRARAGEPVVREGETDSGLFLIREGSVRVTARVSEREVALALLRPGEVFGDVAAVLGRPRSATVSAVTDVELLQLSRADVLALLGHRPRVRQELEEIQLERFAANARLFSSGS